MSSREFAEWAAYAQIEPFGPVRGDLRAGVVASVIAEVYRDPDKRSEPFTPAEFMPMFDWDAPVPGAASDFGPGPGHATPAPDPAVLFARLKAGLGLNKDEKGRGKG
jgi:hypothetical protein